MKINKINDELNNIIFEVYTRQSIVLYGAEPIFKCLQIKVLQHKKCCSIKNVAANWKQVEASVFKCSIDRGSSDTRGIFMNIQLLLQSAAGSRVRFCSHQIFRTILRNF